MYDDAWMPNMQRITWNGLALHGGPLPVERGEAINTHPAGSEMEIRVRKSPPLAVWLLVPSGFTLATVFLISVVGIFPLA
jgi:hypothetical protein